MLKIPWTAVADLLLSSLCNKVGNELYEMDAIIRTELLRDLVADPRFGDQRIIELSDFLLAYVQHRLYGPDTYVRDFARTQQWTALAYTKTGEAARQLAEALLSSLREENIAEQVRLVSLIETFAELFIENGFVPLVSYARGIGYLAHGDVQSATTQFDQVAGRDHSIQIQGVRLPIPGRPRAQELPAALNRTERKRQGRILIVDNLLVWREELVETLQRKGYYANSASTTVEAIRRLNENFYHVLVTSIRMNEIDERNTEGLELLGELEKSGLSEATKAIILSAFDTPDHMRLAFKDYKVVDFLSKSQFSKEAFLSCIEQAFAKEARINLGLEILSRTGSNIAKQAVLNLDIKGSRVKQGDERHDLIAEELEDLLCRLFYETKGILVRLVPAGKSGAGVLRVQPFYNNRGIGREVIVKFGDARKIQEERLRFKEYVEPFIGGGRSTAIHDMRRTTHLGGIIYTFLGTGNQELKDFADFYHSASVEQITKALDVLFQETCSTWYANRQRQLLDLKADYQRLIGYTPGELDQIRLKQFKSVRGKQKLTFTTLSSQRKFTNPLLVMAETSLARTTYTCTTHGDFNPRNLLVDSTGHVWLIDFQGTGLSHILRDIAMLDSAIRFQLLAEGAASLDERFHLEEMLLSDIQRFSQVEQLADSIQTENQEITKAYATVVHLRRLAYRLMAQSQQDDTHDDISEYYIALFYTALNTLQFFSLSPAQREHALLSASLLAEHLGFDDE